MNYREFAEYIESNLPGLLNIPGKIRIRLIDGNEENNIIIAVSRKKKGYFHIISVTDSYEELKNGKSPEDIMHDIAKETEKNLLFLGNVKRSDVEDWEGVKDKVYPKLIGPESSYFRPELMPHREVADMIGVNIIEIRGKKGIKIAPVTHSMFGQYADDYGITIADLQEAAMENLRQHRSRPGALKEEDPGLFEKLKAEGFSDVYRVEARQTLNAPEIMLDGEELKEFSTLAGGDFLIFPLSLARVFLAPAGEGDAGDEAERLRAFLLENSPDEPEPFAPEKVYIYDSEAGEIRLLQ